jgi:hypothetical protein
MMQEHFELLKSLPFFPSDSTLEKTKEGFVITSKTKTIIHLLSEQTRIDHALSQNKLLSSLNPLYFHIPGDNSAHHLITTISHDGYYYSATLSEKNDTLILDLYLHKDCWLRKEEKPLPYTNVARDLGECFKTWFVNMSKFRLQHLLSPKEIEQIRLWK